MIAHNTPRWYMTLNLQYGAQCMMGNRSHQAVQQHALGWQTDWEPRTSGAQLSCTPLQDIRSKGGHQKIDTACSKTVTLVMLLCSPSTALA